MTTLDPSGRRSAGKAAEEAWRRLRPELAAAAVDALGQPEADAFLARVEVAVVDVHAPLVVLYGQQADVDELLQLTRVGQGARRLRCRGAGTGCHEVLQEGCGLSLREGAPRRRPVTPRGSR